MDTSTILFIVGTVMTILGFWIVDWKTKVDQMRRDFDNYRVDMDKQLHTIELNQSKLIGREELHKMRDDIKDEIKSASANLKEDFISFKTDLKESFIKKT